MKLTENVEGVTLDGLRRFIEQADRNGAPGDTPIQMTNRRNRDVVTLAVEFEPTASRDAPVYTVTYPLDDRHSQSRSQSLPSAASLLGDSTSEPTPESTKAWTERVRAGRTIVEEERVPDGTVE